jgi:hypothetical protein
MEFPKKFPLKRLSPEISSFNAGDIVPGDCLVDGSKDLFVDEATLTQTARNRI